MIQSQSTRMSSPLKQEIRGSDGLHFTADIVSSGRNTLNYWIILQSLGELKQEKRTQFLMIAIGQRTNHSRSLNKPVPQLSHLYNGEDYNAYRRGYYQGQKSHHA